MAGGGDPRKYKTEFCRYYPFCPYGNKCLYAHSNAERRCAHGPLYRQRPCWSWISTGACPYGEKCSYIHDPRIECRSEHTETAVSPTKGAQSTRIEGDPIHWPLQRHDGEPTSPRIQYKIRKTSAIMTVVAHDIYSSLIKSVDVDTF